MVSAWLLIFNVSKLLVILCFEEMGKQIAILTNHTSFCCLFQQHEVRFETTQGGNGP
jgi:hypothetical protein